MSTWLKLLPLEIQSVDTLIEPTEEVKEGETVAGVVSDGLKKLWTLSSAGKKAAALLEVELRYTPSAGPEERGRMTEQASKANAMEMIFWIGAMDELQLWGHPEACALRVGWQVVEFKRPETNPFKFLGFGPQL